MRTVRDDSWPMDIRCAALEAYVRVRQDDSQSCPVRFRALLDEVYAGVLATQDDDGLLGTLLMELYPDNLTVSGARWLPARTGPSNLGPAMRVFWTDHLIEKSTIEQMVQLLDLTQSADGAGAIGIG